ERIPASQLRAHQGDAPPPADRGRSQPVLDRQDDGARIPISLHRARAKRMRVLITGAAGFLGSHLCDRFLREGYEVVGVDNMITGHLDNLGHLKGERRFTFVESDIAKPVRRDGTLRGPFTGVLHFASLASPIDYLEHPIETL